MLGSYDSELTERHFLCCIHKWFLKIWTYLRNSLSSSESFGRSMAVVTGRTATVGAMVGVLGVGCATCLVVSLCVGPFVVSIVSGIKLFSAGRFWGIGRICCSRFWLSMGSLIPGVAVVQPNTGNIGWLNTYESQKFLLNIISIFRFLKSSKFWETKIAMCTKWAVL